MQRRPLSKQITREQCWHVFLTGLSPGQRPFHTMLRVVSSSFRSLRTFSAMASSTPKPCKLALVQLAVTANKNDNLANARTHVLEAASKGANLVVLPVCCRTKRDFCYLHTHTPQQSTASAHIVSSYPLRPIC